MTNCNKLHLIRNGLSPSFAPVVLALALFLTVCGTLRIIDGVGIGELLLLVLAAAGWFQGKRTTLLQSPFAWFWALLTILMGIGYLFNDLVANWVRRDMIAYLYTGVVSQGLLLLVRVWSDQQIRLFLRTLLAISLTTLWLGFVVYLTGDSDWIRALHMDDQGDVRYTAWTTNANQLALFFVPLPIWILALKPQGSWLRYGAWLMGILAVMLMGLIVRSDALVLSWGLGLLLLMLIDWSWGNRRELKALAMLAILALVALLAVKLLASGDVRTTFKCSVGAVVHLENPIDKGCVVQETFEGVESFRTGYAPPSYKTEIRFGLWKNAVTVISDSPWFGHGPGAFSWYADPTYQAGEEAVGKMREEAHNIPLDLMTQGGVFLGLAWLGLLAWLMIIAWRAREAYAFVWVFMLGFFTLFMYHLRHPYLWVSLILAQEVVRRQLWSLKEKTNSDELV